MADHIAAAQRYRARAAKCELSTKNTTSAGFAECYRLLAGHYLVLSNLEEDCAHRQSPFARPDDSKAEEQAPGRSVAGRIFAMRQLQMAPPRWRPYRCRRWWSLPYRPLNSAPKRSFTAPHSKPVAKVPSISKYYSAPVHAQNIGALRIVLKKKT